MRKNGLFLVSALMIFALVGCTKGNKEASSEKESTPSSSESTPSSSESTPTSETSSGGGQTSTAQTVTINEAPAAGHTVYAHGWEPESGNWAKHFVPATVNGLNITFDFGEVALDGILLAELNDGYTELNAESVWETVVLRQTNNFTQSDTTATWKVDANYDSFVGVAPNGSWDNMYKVELTANPENLDEVMNASITLNPGDVFYLQVKIGEATGYPKILKADSSANITKSGDNFVVGGEAAAAYSFYATLTEVYIGDVVA